MELEKLAWTANSLQGTRGVIVLARWATLESVKYVQ